MISAEDDHPFSLNYVLKMARDKDQQGKKSQWYMKGGPERAIASNIYQVAEQIALKIYGP